MGIFRRALNSRGILTCSVQLKNERDAGSAIAINKLNMAWRQWCLRLITVDETTVSSSRSHLYLRDFSFYSAPLASPTLRCIAPSPRPPLRLPPFSRSLHHVDRNVLNIPFSLPGYPLFFPGVLLISFHSVLRTRRLSFSLRLPPRPSFLLLLPLCIPECRPLRFIRLPILLARTPPVSLWSFSFVIAGNTRVRRPPRAQDSIQRSAS